MFNRVRGRWEIAFLLVLSLWAGLCSGCSGAGKEELTTAGFAFDTTYKITLYEGGTKEILDSCIQKCSGYERVFSRTQEDSELYQVNELEKLYGEAAGKPPFSKKDTEKLVSELNRRKSEKNNLQFQIDKEGGLTIVISDMLRDLMKKGLQYSEESEGSFDISIEPVTSLWNFKSENETVPDGKAIEEALPLVDYRRISLEGNNLCFLEPGMGIDLGGIAKGYIADELKNYLKEQGVTSALIDLGGNVLCLGGKSGRDDFRIGVQQPFADRNETIAVLEVQDLSVVSSGIYERYIETKEGTLYHHILNPKTGYSYDNELLGVTILSEYSVDGDGLSTTCFSMGKEKGIRFINSRQGVYAMFITKDEKVWYSDGFEDFLARNNS